MICDFCCTTTKAFHLCEGLVLPASVAECFWHQRPEYYQADNEESVPMNVSVKSREEVKTHILSPQ